VTCWNELAALPQHYYILEVSADLRARQERRLAILPQALRERLRWLDVLPAAPMAGVLLANEVADALPFKRFTVTSDAPLELGVALSADGALIEAERPADELLAAEVAQLAASLPAPLPPGYRSELCPMLQPRGGAAHRLWLGQA
jgi:SAM-dependent MidA family methyltransferase